MTVNHDKNEKVSIMTYRAMFFNILMSMLCCMYSPTTVAFQRQGAMPQMQDFEAELEEANRAIEEYIASLPPAEQAEFNRQVEDMARMFENMSEDDFEKFLGEMFTDEQMMEPNPFEISQPETIEEVATVVLSADDKKKIETAVKVVDDIINQTNLFMVIVNSSPELPNRITRWATKGSIANWQGATEWDTLKTALDSFVQQLYKTLDQDLTTKKYKYLFDLIGDEGLYNNIIQLQTELNALVPTINIPEFSVQKLSTQSKATIKDILNKYTESFNLLGIPKSLNDLFAKYAPEEEKIRSAEDAANKKAAEAQKGTRTPAGATSAGMAPDSGYGYDYGSNYYGGDYGYNPYDSYGSYGNDYGYGNNYGNDYGYNNASGRNSGGNAGGSSRGGTNSSGKTEDKDKDKKSPTKFVPNYKIERAIADVKSGLQDITTALTPDEKGLPTNLANLVESVGKENVDIILAGSTLPMVDKKLSTIDDALNIIIKEALNADDLSHYQREIKNAFEKNVKQLKSLRDAIDTFEIKEKDEKAQEKEEDEEDDEDEDNDDKDNDDDSKKINVSSLSKQKQWAYFGQGTLSSDKADAELQEQITTTVSLFNIKDKINTVLKDLDKLMAKKAVVAKSSESESTSDVK